MKLNELINKNEEVKKMQEELQEIKENVTIEILKLKEIGVVIGKLEKVKLEELKTQCMDEAKEFFESGKFLVESTEKRIIAKHKDIIIDFKDDSEDEMLVFPIEIQPLKVYNAIEIRPCLKDRNMFYQKNNLKLGDFDFGFNNYADLLDKCNDKDSLLKLIERIRENITHYQNTINKFDNIRYVYSLYQQAVECDTFKEIFEDHIN